MRFPVSTTAVVTNLIQDSLGAHATARTENGDVLTITDAQHQFRVGERLTVIITAGLEQNEPAAAPTNDCEARQ